MTADDEDEDEEVGLELELLFDAKGEIPPVTEPRWPCDMEEREWDGVGPSLRVVLVDDDDDDDELVKVAIDDAIERVVSAWETIPKAEGKEEGRLSRRCGVNTGRREGGGSTSSSAKEPFDGREEEDIEETGLERLEHDELSLRGGTPNIHLRGRR